MPLLRSLRAQLGGPADRPLRVLVADDEPLNRSITTAFLGLSGHQVETVADGAAAIAAAASGDFDVILMDVRMPGIDGMEATRRIRELPGPRGQVHIIAVTARNFARQIDECRAAGMDGHLSKPLDPDRLRAALAAPAAPPAATPIPANQAAIFEHAVFDELAASLPPDDFAAHLRLLQDRCEAMADRLRAPAPPADPDSLLDQVHRLSGGAGIFGFHGVSDAARRYEESRGAAPGTPAAQRLLDALEAALPALRQAIAGCPGVPA